jgi:hypothetical protein
MRFRRRLSVGNSFGATSANVAAPQEKVRHRGAADLVGSEKSRARKRLACVRDNARARMSFLASVAFRLFFLAGPALGRPLSARTIARPSPGGAPGRDNRAAGLGGAHIAIGRPAFAGKPARFFTAAISSLFLRCSMGEWPAHSLHGRCMEARLE